MSVWFVTGTPSWGVYAAMKLAVEGFSEALYAELKPLGVNVTIVEPGLFRTDFLYESSLHSAEHPIPDYADMVGATRRFATERNHAQQGDPVKAAAAMVAHA